MTKEGRSVLDRVQDLVLFGYGLEYPNDLAEPMVVKRIEVLEKGGERDNERGFEKDLLVLDDIDVVRRIRLRLQLLELEDLMPLLWKTAAFASFYQKDQS